MLSLRLLLPVLVALVVLLLWHPPCVSASPEMTDRAKKFVEAHTAKLRPLEIAANLAWWNANISGKAEDFQKKEETQNRIDEALANPEAFQQLKELKQNSKEIDDPVTARAIEVLYLAYLEKQLDTELLKKIVARANAVEKTFNEFRPEI